MVEGNPSVERVVGIETGPDLRAAIAELQQNAARLNEAVYALEGVVRGVDEQNG